MEMRYGAGIEEDTRLRKMRDREFFLLNVVIPRHRTLRDAAKGWFQRSLKPEVFCSMAVVLVVYVVTATFCGFDYDHDGDGGLCAGGPTDGSGQPLAYLSFYEGSASCHIERGTARAVATPRRVHLPSYTAAFCWLARHRAAQTTALQS